MGETNVNLSFPKIRIGFGTFRLSAGCQGFVGPVPPPFLISFILNELLQK